MFASQPQFKKWVSLSAALGFTVFILYLYFFTDFASVATVIEQTSVPIYALAFLCVLGGAAFQALTWQRILGNLSVETTFRRVFNLSWVGIFVDSLVPGGWSGDIFKAYLLSKEGKVDGAKSAASIVIKNVLELIVTLAALIAGIVLLALNYTIEGGVIFAVGVTMFLIALPLILVIYLSVNLQATKRMLKVVNRITARIKGKQVDTSDFEGKIQNSLNEFHEGIMTMKTNPKSMVQPIIFQTAAWAFDILALFLIFAAIGNPISPDKVIITNAVVVGLQSQGVALAGFVQMVSSGIYGVLGINGDVSVASSLLAMFATFWFKIVISFFAFQITVFERCIPFICVKCGGLRKSCKEEETPLLKKDQSL